MYFKIAIISFLYCVTHGTSLQVHAQEEVQEEITDDLQSDLNQDAISSETSEDMGTWLLAPKLSNGPKFGLLLGASVNHVIKLDNSSLIYQVSLEATLIPNHLPSLGIIEVIGIWTQSVLQHSLRPENN